MLRLWTSGDPTAARCTLAQAGFIARLSALLRGPTYRIAAAIKGSSHRVDLHGTSRVQVHDGLRAGGWPLCRARQAHSHEEKRHRRRVSSGAHAPGACESRCGTCVRGSLASEVSIIGIHCTCASEPAQRGAAQHVNGKHAGHIPAPLRAAASRDVGARGAHPRTPASLCAGSGDAGQASDHCGGGARPGCKKLLGGVGILMSSARSCLRVSPRQYEILGLPKHRIKSLDVSRGCI